MSSTLHDTIFEGHGRVAALDRVAEAIVDRAVSAAFVRESAKKRAAILHESVEASLDSAMPPSPIEVDTLPRFPSVPTIRRIEAELHRRRAERDDGQRSEGPTRVLQ